LAFAVQKKEQGSINQLVLMNVLCHLSADGLNKKRKTFLLTHHSLRGLESGA
jgi:hypothetical protein